MESLATLGQIHILACTTEKLAVTLLIYSDNFCTLLTEILAHLSDSYSAAIDTNN